MQFPQGGIDNGETIEKAISREMREELGFKFINDMK
ncbi:MAG: NUDIX domain-containing protein, partial [Patescibacteria group bacterium]|nr:NUDIX domain-containing protein [Patescibacteria group bacterium]